MNISVSDAVYCGDDGNGAVIEYAIITVGESVGVSLSAESTYSIDVSDSVTADDGIIEVTIYFVDDVLITVSDAPVVSEHVGISILAAEAAAPATRIVEFSNAPDLEKLIIVEIELARKLEEQTWTQHGTYTNTWYISMPDDAEVHKVKEDGTEYDEVFSISDCNGTASQFYYDDLNKVLYVHTSGSDDPATLDGSDPKYSIIAYFWELFSNRPKQVERFDNVLINPGLEYWESTTNLEDWTENTAGSSIVEQDGTTVYDSDSAYSAKLSIDASDSVAHIRQNITLRPGRKARVRFKYKNSAVGKNGWLIFRDSGSNVYLQSDGTWNAGWAGITLSNSETWTEYDLEFVTHDDYSSYTIIIRNQTAASSDINIDDVEVCRYRRMADCKTYLNLDSIPSVYQMVGDYYQPDEQIQFGAIKFKNTDNWFWSRRLDDGYLWHNKSVKLFVALISDNYDELAVFFTGVTRTPRLGVVTEIDVNDRRVLLQKIPTEKFDSTNYPNCEDAWKDKEIPILFGSVEGINPPQCNTSNYTYKVSQTDFDGVTYPIYSVLSVYKDGSLLSTPADYSVDLNAGTFTLMADPGDSEITCRAQGICCDTVTSGSGTKSYTEYIGFFVFFLYTILNNISKYDINLASILDLNSRRNFGCGHWINSLTDSIDVMQKWKETGVFQSFAELNGMHKFHAYSADVSSEAPYFYNEDYHSELIIGEDTDQCYKKVTAKGDYHPADDYFEDISTATEDSTEYEHDEREEIEFEVITYLAFTVRDIASNYLSILKDPIEILTVTLPAKALLLNPCDKAYFSYSRTDEDGTELTILDDTVYRFVALNKDVNRGLVEAKLIRDKSEFNWFF